MKVFLNLCVLLLLVSKASLAADSPKDWFKTYGWDVSSCDVESTTPPKNNNPFFKTTLYNSSDIDNGYRKFGETTFSVSSPEILETAIGDVEVFKYTAQEQWVYAEYFLTSWQSREVAELSTTVWIHPQIGILKTESLVKFDDTPSSSGSFVETDLTLEIRSVNFSLPE